MIILCSQCRASFNKKESEISRTKNNYCSKLCYYQSKKKVLNKCKYCNKKTSNKYYCCINCSNKSKKRSKLKQYFCKRCNKLLAIGWNELKKTKFKNLCKQCNTNYVDWSKVTLKEFKSNKTLSNYHGRLRALARTVYSNSNKPKQCYHCKYKLHYEVCHIKDVKQFDLQTPISTVNNINNLIALCRNCHWEFDNGYLII